MNFVETPLNLYSHTFKLLCKLLNEGVIDSCENCNLKSICNGIDKVRDDYIESTSTVVKEFNF